MVPSSADASARPLSPNPGLGRVLDVLAAQVGETARHVEQSVAQVCASFAGIARRAKAGATHAARAAAPGGGAGSQDQARDTIAALLDRMDRVQRAVEESVSTLRRVEAIADRVEKVQRHLDDVDLVAYALRILAMNAQIEAARAGDRGAAFGVVAAETGRQADVIGGMAKSVRELVNVLWNEVCESARAMRAGLAHGDAAADLGKATHKSREDGRKALAALAAAQTEMQGLVGEAADNSRRLVSDIEDAITALQFQDAVNQQLEHVAQALHEARAALDAGDAGRADELLARLGHRATMKSERDLLTRMTGQPADADDSAGGSIELF